MKTHIVPYNDRQDAQSVHDPAADTLTQYLKVHLKISGDAECCMALMWHDGGDPYDF